MRGWLAQVHRPPRPPTADAALAGAFALAGLVEVAITSDGPLALLLPVVLVTVAPVAWRRQAPFVSLVVALATVGAAKAAGYPGNATYLLFVLVVAFYSLGAWLDLRGSAWRAGLALAAILGLVNSGGFHWDDSVFVLLVYGGAWLVGLFVRRPRQRALELERRTADLEVARAETAREAAEQERARIAREMHDVVAHSVSVMVIQAGAVRRRLENEQGREREALESVERTGREALVEMRRMLGVLRSDGEHAELGPQPGAAELEQLAQQVRSAGLPVTLTVDGASSLPAGPGLAVYRIVQEALTNILKHADARMATVTVTVGPRAVELEVLDDGTRPATDRRPRPWPDRDARARRPVRRNAQRRPGRAWRVRGACTAAAGHERRRELVTIRIVIADDQVMVRAGFRLLLDTEPDIEVVGEASDGDEALRTARRTRPDVVLMDVRMPVLDGIEATRRLLADVDVTCRVLVLTTFDLDEYVFGALARGRQRLSAEGCAARGADRSNSRRRGGRRAARAHRDATRDRALRHASVPTAYRAPRPRASSRPASARCFSRSRAVAPTPRSPGASS